MGSRLGSLDGWNGDHPIHILSAGNAFLKITLLEAALQKNSGFFT